jgi:opacity protein-like surface antigen
MQMGVSTGPKMRALLLSAASVVIFTGGAAAETASLNLSEGDSVLLPPVASIAQPTLSRSESSETKSAAINLDFGNHFSTQLEGAAISVPAGHLVTNLPNSGGVASTSLMLNGLYEIDDGTWHLKPYVGGGFGFVDANSRVLGLTASDWQTAYQVHGGVQLGFTEKLIGSIEYRWTSGSKPGLYVAGIPTKVNIGQHGFTIGVDYKY